MFRIPVSGSVLVKGRAGCGKTIMMKSMMSLIPPSSADVVLISPFANEEYKALNNAGLIKTQAVTTEQAEQAIADAYKTFKERQEDDENGAMDMCPLYLFIDEAPTIKKDLSDDAAEHLLELISCGHNAEIHVIVGGQHFLDEDFEARFPVKIDTENGVVNYRDSPMLVAQ